MAHAYHAIVSALEDPRLSPSELFARQVAASLDGQRCYRQFHALGERIAERRSLTPQAIEERVAHWLALDLNPLLVLARRAPDDAAALRLYNLYNERATLGVRTRLAPDSDRDRLSVESRRSALATSDPEPCRQASLAAVSLALRLRRAAVDAGGLPGLAAQVGVGGTAAADVAAALAAGASPQVPALARGLGTSARTLQRQLARQHLTIGRLAAAHRLHQACQGLTRPGSLTDLALACGYADLAHMTRAFVHACRMPPSGVRSCLLPREPPATREAKGKT